MYISHWLHQWALGWQGSPARKNTWHCASAASSKKKCQYQIDIVRFGLDLSDVGTTVGSRDASATGKSMLSIKHVFKTCRCKHVIPKKSAQAKASCMRSISLWGAIKSWSESKLCQPERKEVKSDTAIRTCLMSEVFHTTSRATQIPAFYISLI